ncbi:hypothetical protein AK812_SmicGene46083, partial [Symbiodinium microadriaticum]
RSPRFPRRRLGGARAWFWDRPPPSKSDRRNSWPVRAEAMPRRARAKPQPWGRRRQTKMGSPSAAAWPAKRPPFIPPHLACK